VGGRKKTEKQETVNSKIQILRENSEEGGGEYNTARGGQKGRNFKGGKKVQEKKKDARGKGRYSWYKKGGGTGFFGVRFSG